jgi:hypothetical protein
MGVIEYQEAAVYFFIPLSQQAGIYDHENTLCNLQGGHLTSFPGIRITTSTLSKHIHPNHIAVNLLLLSDT